MKTNKKEITWYKDIYQWLPTFEKDVRKANPRFFDKKLNVDIVKWYDSDPAFREFADQQYEIRKEKFFRKQSKGGIKGGNKRVENSTPEELSETAIKGGTASMAKRREEGTLSEFSSNGGRVAWSKKKKKMHNAALKNVKIASAAAYKRVSCTSCGKDLSQATSTRWHAIEEDGRCRVQRIYESLPDKFMKREIEEQLKEIHTILDIDSRIKILYKPSTINQITPVIYCKEEVYDDLIDVYKDMKTPKEMILQNLPIDEEFTGAYLRELATKYGFKKPKRILKDYCVRTYLGGGKNPTRYKLIAK